MLIISGHFGGTFFGKSKKELSLDDLENQNCNNSCDGILKNPKAVYLFGCNTLSGKQQDTRTYAQYVQILVNDEIPRQQAEAIAESRYGPTGQTNRDRMVRVFNRSPRIYGYDSIGPSGKNVQSSLEQFFKSNPNYEVDLKKLEKEQNTNDIEALKKYFNKSNNKTQDRYLSCLKNQNVICANGVCEINEELTELLCSIRDESNPVVDRLNILNGVLKRKDALSFLPTAVILFNRIERQKLSNEEQIAIQNMKNNKSLKDSLLNIIKTKHILISQKAEWIAFAEKMEWITGDRAQAEMNVALMTLTEDLNSSAAFDLLSDLSHRHPRWFSSESIAMLAKHIQSEKAEIRSGVNQVLRTIRPSDPRIDEQIAVHLNNSSPVVRRDALDALEVTLPRDPKVHLQIAENLKHSEAYVRRMAVRVLGKVQTTDPKIIAQIADLLLDQDEQTRASAFNALVNIQPNSDPVTVKKVQAAGIDVTWKKNELKTIFY